MEGEKEFMSNYRAITTRNHKYSKIILIQFLEGKLTANKQS